MGEAERGEGVGVELERPPCRGDDDIGVVAVVGLSLSIGLLIVTEIGVHGDVSTPLSSGDEDPFFFLLATREL